MIRVPVRAYLLPTWQPYHYVHNAKIELEVNTVIYWFETRLKIQYELTLLHTGNFFESISEGK